MSFKLEDVLKDIDDAVSTVKVASKADESVDEVKTAADAKSEPASKDAEAKADVEASTDKVAEDNSDDILAIIERAVADSEKTASEADSPADDIRKLAADIANQDMAAMSKKAEIIGTAIADAVVSRLQVYEKVAAEAQREQTASVFQNAVDGMSKAASAGYQEATAVLEKLATASFEDGYTKTAAVLVHGELYNEGQKTAAALIARDRKDA